MSCNELDTSDTTSSRHQADKHMLTMLNQLLAKSIEYLTRVRRQKHKNLSETKNSPDHYMQ